MTNTVSGVLKFTKKGEGVLREPAFSFRRKPDEVRVPAGLIREYRLVEGASLTGSMRKERHGPLLSLVDSICGLTPEAFYDRRSYTALTAIDPCQRFHLAASGEASMRIVDLMAPIGKGTRGMIVSPPKAGKTMLMEQIARAIHADDPGTRIIVLLIDERPEEVTDMQRSVNAEVIASTFDEPADRHVKISNIVLEKAKRLVECGHDVVILLDSITLSLIHI